jgi:pimeloyl-ACP methyl ester carboxylesterase
MKKTIASLALCALACQAGAETLTTMSHRPGLNIRLRHTLPATPSVDAPVLFIHGSSFPSGLAFDFPMDGQSWMDWMAAQGADVYALDFLGYGLSDRYPEMEQAGIEPLGRAQDAAVDIGHAVDLILARTGKSRVTLIAHSWGGSVAARYASLTPEKVDKLVLFAGITVRDDATKRESVAAGWEELTPSQRISSMNELAPVAERPQLHPDVFAHWGPLWLQSAKASSHVRFPSGPSQDVDDFRHGQRLYDPARIVAPTLLVRGEWDSYPDHADAQRLLREMVRSTHKQYVVIPKGTHVLHLEHARHELYVKVFEFLHYHGGFVRRSKIEP